MYEIMYGGQQLWTSRAVAEAVMDYATALMFRGGWDVVRLPVVIEGVATEARLSLGPAVALGIVALPGEPNPVLAAEGATVQNLRERMASVRSEDDSWRSNAS